MNKKLNILFANFTETPQLILDLSILKLPIFYANQMLSVTKSL